VYTIYVLANLETKTRMEIARLSGNGGLEAMMDLLHVDETSVT
jgi:geranylgeranyl diphosphate synthase type 3